MWWGRGESGALGLVGQGGVGNGRGVGDGGV